jgi:hypothetical protein
MFAKRCLRHPIKTGTGEGINRAVTMNELHLEAFAMPD